MKYTLKTIKDTVCYKSNIAAVQAVYPQDWQKFARELMIALNDSMVDTTHWDLLRTFRWDSSPQGAEPWEVLYDSLRYYKSIEGIHSCGYHCEIPACIKRQRDELVKKFIKEGV